MGENPRSSQPISCRSLNVSLVTSLWLLSIMWLRRVRPGKQGPRVNRRGAGGKGNIAAPLWPVARAICPQGISKGFSQVIAKLMALEFPSLSDWRSLLRATWKYMVKCKEGFDSSRSNWAAYNWSAVRGLIQELPLLLEAQDLCKLRGRLKHL